MRMHQGLAYGKSFRLPMTNADFVILMLASAQSGDGLLQKRLGAGVFKKLSTGDAGGAVVP